jgi:hypothetical protein
VLFPNRLKPEAYNFGAPKGTEWFVDEITGHRWVGRKLECQVKWNLGDTTWEPVEECDKLEALDAYLVLMGVKECKELPKRAACVAPKAPHRK